MQGTSQTLVAGEFGHEPAVVRSAAETQVADTESGSHVALSEHDTVQIPHMQASELPHDALLSQDIKKWVSPPLELSFGSGLQLINVQKVTPNANAKRRPIRRGSFVMTGLSIAVSDKTLPGVYHHTGVVLGNFVLAVESLNPFTQIAQLGSDAL